jgi:hypothetical protein
MPGMRWHAARGSQPADLSAIWRTDALMDLLAARRLLRPHTFGDPAIALLSGLAADVDAGLGTRLAAAVMSAACARLAGGARPAAAARTGTRAATASVAAGATGRVPGDDQLARRPHRAGRHRRPRGVQTVAAAMMVTVAAVAAAAWLLAASMMIRLGMGPRRRRYGR